MVLAKVPQMTPKKFVKFVSRDAHGNLIETPKEFQKLADIWNAQDEVSDVSEEVELMVLDEYESPDDPGDENDDPRGDEQP